MKTDDFHELNDVPVRGEVERLPEFTEKPVSTGSFLHPKVKPWDSTLLHDDIRFEIRNLRDIEFRQALKLVERYGICVMRFVATTPDPNILEYAEKHIGPACPRQNDFVGPIKTLIPKPSGQKGSGETLQDLGLHIDGTQDAEPPIMLAFQYVTEPRYGATSIFTDGARVLADIPERDRLEILFALARKDAATFSKKGFTYTGPIVSCKPQHGDNAIGVRIRFDEVISVNPPCQWAFDLLKERYNDKRYWLEILPQEGDIVLFDNLRLLHARDEVYGQNLRQHNRMWIANLNTNNRSQYNLGIRIADARTIAMINVRNR